MPKMRFEMLKTRKKKQHNQAWENFPGTFRIAQIPRIFGRQEFFETPGKCFANFPFTGKLEIREKEKP